MPGEVIVSAVAITLDRTVKIARNEFLQTLRLPSRVPLIVNGCEVSELISGSSDFTLAFNK
jgi:hypothetical protein